MQYETIARRISYLLPLFNTKVLNIITRTKPEKVYSNSLIARVRVSKPLQAFNNSFRSVLAFSGMIVASINNVTAKNLMYATHLFAVSI
jgi:hypothetical protein